MFEDGSNVRCRGASKKFTKCVFVLRFPSWCRSLRWGAEGKWTTPRWWGWERSGSHELLQLARPEQVQRRGSVSIGRTRTNSKWGSATDSSAFTFPWFERASDRLWSNAKASSSHSRVRAKQNSLEPVPCECRCLPRPMLPQFLQVNSN